MKRIYALGISLLMSGGVFAQNINDLPSAVSDYIEEHFAGSQVEKIDKNNSWYNISDSETYEIQLSNGMELDFNKKGELTEIESDGEEIPVTVLDRSVRDYVERNYTNAVIINYELDRDGYDLELDDGTELIFDKEGNFEEEDS